MSLLDSMLLDPYRDPREIWIARRTDGQRGSGTIDDPYDGGTRLAAPLSVTGLDRVMFEVTATTASAHGLIDGDVVAISGVTGGSAGVWNSEFPIFDASGTTFKYRMQIQPEHSAGGGGWMASRVIYLFDELMRNMPDHACIHLGPAVFETRGFNGVAHGWRAKEGQRILGAGIGNTSLKLVHATNQAAETLAIASDPFSGPPYLGVPDGFEASDFTVDCNMRAQLSDKVAKGAIAVGGKHVRIRRVRAIDFGTHSDGVECFVIGVCLGHPALQEGLDCRIENCVIEQPSLNGLYNNSCLILSSGEEPASSGSRMGWHRAGVIRHNYVNHEYLDRPVAIASIGNSGWEATAITRSPHHRQVGDWLVISGAQVGGSLENNFNGSYQIAQVLSATSLRYTMVDWTGHGAPVSAPTGDMWVGRYSSHRVSVRRLEKDASDSTGLTAILSSHTPHQRLPGQRLLVWQTADPRPAGTAPYYGRFLVTEVVSPTILKYRMDSTPATACVEGAYPPAACAYDGVFLGPSSVAFSTDGGSEAVAEGNRVFTTSVGGSYHDTWGTKDQMDRDNYYSDVTTGPYENIQLTSPLKLGLLSVTGGIATFTADHPHGMVVGQAVRIASNNEPPLEDAYYRIQSVPTATTITFDTGGTTPPGNYFAALWQVGLAIREGNVIELGRAYHEDTGWGYSSGLPFYAGDHGTEFVFRAVIARHNSIRLVAGSSNDLARAIQLRNVERAVVENNLVDVKWQPPLDIGTSKPLHFFNNQDSTGDLSQPTEGTASDDLRTRIEDALTLAL